jgi:hypothetical protein
MLLHVPRVTEEGKTAMPGIEIGKEGSDSTAASLLEEEFIYDMYCHY